MDERTEEAIGEPERVTVPLELGGLRLDQAMGQIFPGYSRSRHQLWIREGRIRLNGDTATPKTRLIGGEEVSLSRTFETTVTATAEAIPLQIVHEDDWILILDKPHGLVVHPAAGHAGGTLLNALLHHAPALETVPRAGIVHRLDKDTSGLLMVAKTVEAHKQLVDQLQARTVRREYLALVHGALTGGGTIDQPIGRHGADRKRFAVRPDGKIAITHYRIAERFEAHTLIQVRLETGRTHQIRVHLAHLQHPLVGDPVYGGRARLPRGAGADVINTLRQFRRQALHAAVLGITHPGTGAEMSWERPLPEDFLQLLACLRGNPPR